MEERKAIEETTVESVEDLNDKFRDLTVRAKKVAYGGDLKEGLKLYKKAYKIH